MMAMLQNAFANSASSLIQSKVSGSIVFILLSPLSYMEIFLAYVLASIVRGLLVGVGVYLATLIFFEVPLRSLVWIFLFALMGNGLLGALGIIAAIWAEKFDQLAAFQNFVILPLTFLSGVFYTIHSLPPFWEGLSHFNPFFYVIDGFRYGFFWCFRYFTLLQSCDCGGMLSNGIMDYIANAQDGLQASSLRFLFYENEYIEIVKR